ncbi:ubiquitin carboxyl-terminal hydrolase miy1 [Anaeramoeba flamelloides]|uniref:Ubiquitin carboxyl-terminal hydrolase miy1 n=1 Tax=Anaeramoeba flamelloides TaxID=1746091 RepID=A0AAV7Y0V0_9EUKA|nr:ubiquitin carboxyl-terminal hydrolase miy1 [Anaeramoeba flamelloides]
MSDSFYYLKKIQFFGKTRSVVIQNLNGPCPLVAVSNALLLFGRLNIPLDFGIINHQQLIEMLTNYLFSIQEKNKRSQVSTGQLVNQQQIISDLLLLLPKLHFGLDLNPKFNSPTSFEYTPQVSLFDVFNIPLFHSWIVSRKHPAYRIIKSLSFNLAIEKIVAMKTLTSPVVKRKNKKEQNNNSTNTKTNTSQSSQLSSERFDLSKIDLSKLIENNQINQKGNNNMTLNEETKEQIFKDLEQLNDQFPKTQQKENSNVNEKEEENEKENEKENEQNIINKEKEEQENKKNVITIQEPETLKEEQKEIEGIHNEEELKTIQTGEIIHGFIEENKTQATYYGLSKLRKSMKELEIGVFFRNNHFSTIFKNKDGNLYLLLTDDGFRTTDRIWERFESLSGDNKLVNYAFKTVDEMKKMPKQSNQQNLAQVPQNYMSEKEVLKYTKKIFKEEQKQKKKQNQQNQSTNYQIALSEKEILKTVLEISKFETTSNQFQQTQQQNDQMEQEEIKNLVKLIDQTTQETERQQKIIQKQQRHHTNHKRNPNKDRKKRSHNKNHKNQKSNNKENNKKNSSKSKCFLM